MRRESRRLLFLDDDPLRAEAFLAQEPEAIWVETVTECLARLTERWDEVHLDHDLGGKQFVDTQETDCGMEVTRWLCQEPRVHLRQTFFFVHTHNTLAGLLMVVQMRESGYQAEFRPFGVNLAALLPGHDPSEPEDVDSSSQPSKSLGKWSARLRSFGAYLYRRTSTSRLIRSALGSFRSENRTEVPR